MPKSQNSNTDVTFTYDDLDRLTDVDYGMDSTDESFTIDDLGNRTGSQDLRSGTESYTVDDETNRYTAIAGNSLTYDAAGNLTKDKDGYTYHYDYENRISYIRKNNDTTDVVFFDYDALGRRVMKYDMLTYDITNFYYDNDWRVLAEYAYASPTDTFQRGYIYGNYVDEVLCMIDDTPSIDYYYAHDHLYSVSALIDDSGSVVERYEYDAYGNCHVLDADYSADADNTSDVGNPYTFTGRRLDDLDSHNLLVMYYRHRSYLPKMGRFMQQDPLGVTPYDDQTINPFNIHRQYIGMNLYEYVRSCPLISSDPQGYYPIGDPGMGYGEMPDFGNPYNPRGSGSIEIIRDRKNNCIKKVYVWGHSSPAVGGAYWQLLGDTDITFGVRENLPNGQFCCNAVIMLTGCHIGRSETVMNWYRKRLEEYNNNANIWICGCTDFYRYRIPFGIDIGDRGYCVGRWNCKLAKCGGK